jgi:hypothetical protein
VFAVLLVLLVGVVAYVLTYLGVVASVIGLVLALIPLAGVLWAVRIVDRWEPEPHRSSSSRSRGEPSPPSRSPSASTSLSVIVPAAADDPVRDAVSSVIQAPLVEEFAKGLGVFLVFVFGRRTFDGPVDGVVYGALVGAGFAFTENILYFATSLIEGGVADTAFTFFLRGILSPFAHVMFTAITGYALGLAARRGAGARSRRVRPRRHAVRCRAARTLERVGVVRGLLPPLRHAAGAAVRRIRPGHRRAAARRGAADRARLSEYAAAGGSPRPRWTSSPRRRAGARARAWARTLPGDRSAAMVAFIRDATSLAAARERTRTGRDPRSTQDERVLLARATAARAALLAR